MKTTRPIRPGTQRLLFITCATLLSVGASHGDAALTAKDAVRRALRAPVVADSLAGVRGWRAEGVEPSPATRGAWLVQVFVPDRNRPWITARIDDESGTLLGVLWDDEALELRRRKAPEIASPRDVLALRTESLRDIVRAVGSNETIRAHLAKYKKARLRAEYAPDADLWVVVIHDADDPLGLVTYSRGRIRDVFVRGLNWDPEVKPKTGTLSLRDSLPNTRGPVGICIMLIAGLILVIDLRRPWGPRTWCFLLLWLLIAVGTPPFDPYPAAKTIAMAGVILLFVLLVRPLRRAGSEDVEHARPITAMALVVVAILAMGVIAMPLNKPSDSSLCGSVVARYIMKEGRLPYGAEISSTTWVPRDRNTYGPVAYAVHIPAEAILPTTYLAEGVRKRIGDAGWTGYFDHTTMTKTATNITGIAVHLIGMAGIGVLGRRLGGNRTMWLWLGLAGLGLRITSPEASMHMVSLAFVIWALVFIHKPAVAGVLLGLGAAAMYYPAFAIPLWLGWYRRKGRGLVPFLVGVCIVALVMGGLIVAFTQAPTAVDAARVFLKDTVLIQEGSEAYGGTYYGFWPSYPKLRAVLQRPVMVAYFVLVVMLAFWPKRCDLRDLVALTAAVFLATQFWKTPGPWYCDWYYHLAFMALFWPVKGGAPSSDEEVGASGCRLNSAAHTEGVC